MWTSDELTAHVARARQWAKERGLQQRGYGSARLGFIAVEPTVAGLLARGFSINATYEYLKAEGMVSMSYGRFAYYVRKRLRGGTDGRRLAAVDGSGVVHIDAARSSESKPPAVQRPALKIPPSSAGGFVFDPDKPVDGW
jgi:hypothetical protein